MKLLPRWVTITGIVIAAAAVLIDPANMPALTALLGANAAAKLAAFGTVVSALGRALVPPKSEL